MTRDSWPDLLMADLQAFRDEVECQHSRDGVECHLEAFLITCY